jgi:hypothetical protein
VPALLWFWLSHRNSGASTAGGDSMNTGEISVTGGANVGWLHASWPFAQLTVSATHLKISMMGTYDFTPDQVVSLERYGSIPILASGIRINHNRQDYPPKFIFYTLGSSTKLLAKIAETGFSPKAPATSAPERRGIPVRWVAIAIAIIIWNGLFFLDDSSFDNSRHELGLGAFMATLLVFFIAWGLRVSQWLQSVVLKEGRSVGEIKPFLYFFQLLTGIGVVAFAIQFAINHAG